MKSRVTTAGFLILICIVVFGCSNRFVPDPSLVNTCFEMVRELKNELGTPDSAWVGNQGIMDSSWLFIGQRVKIRLIVFEDLTCEVQTTEFYSK
ncbi:hypothetical protein C4561_01440 [candidate division WWE3 bacterium]|uniref:Lipoprotein n=1 Tax=candidate division WWE3 bacterium TaxID=2053526 RepID=A0A3A4ZMI2_UNCKA|nr:MAG: hypothetical protein C4561_01440 [candidate division WWE3 bacterium]